jgi:hypothetical protein
LTNPIPSTTANITSIPTTNTATITTNRSGTVGYAPDAAWLAIRRHMQINSFDDQIVSFYLFFKFS